MIFRATSYSMGDRIAGVTVKAASYSAVRRHPKVRALPAAAQGDRSKIQVIGIKLVTA